MSQPQPPFPLSNERQARLAALKTRLDEALTASHGNARLQRHALDRLMVDADMIGVPPLQFLEAYFLERLQGPPPLPAGEGAGGGVKNNEAAFNCPKCQRPFKSQAALSGHGPDRCKKTHNS